MLGRKAILIALQAAQAGSHLPGLDECPFLGIRTGGKAAATEEAMKKVCLYNHANNTRVEGRLSAEYFKTLTIWSEGQPARLHF